MNHGSRGKQNVLIYAFCGIQTRFVAVLLSWTVSLATLQINYFHVVQFQNLDPVTSVVLHGNQVELFISDQAG